MESGGRRGYVWSRVVTEGCVIQLRIWIIENRADLLGLLEAAGGRKAVFMLWVHFVFPLLGCLLLFLFLGVALLVEFRLRLLFLRPDDISFGNEQLRWEYLPLDDVYRSGCFHGERRPVFIGLHLAEQVLSDSLEVLLMVPYIELWEPGDVDVAEFAHADAWAVLHKFCSLG